MPEEMDNMIKLGNSYTNSSGEFIRIISTDESNPNVFLDQIGRSYNKDGTYFYSSWGSNSKYNLIEINSEETFNKINSILNKVPEILPCPFCGSSIEMRWDDNSDCYDEWLSFHCSSHDCGFSYNPSMTTYWNRKQNSIEQKRTIERNVIREVNKRV